MIRPAAQGHSASKGAAGQSCTVQEAARFFLASVGQVGKLQGAVALAEIGQGSSKFVARQTRLLLLQCPQLLETVACRAEVAPAQIALTQQAQQTSPAVVSGGPLRRAVQLQPIDHLVKGTRGEQTAGLAQQIIDRCRVARWHGEVRLTGLARLIGRRKHAVHAQYLSSEAAAPARARDLLYYTATAGGRERNHLAES